MKNAKQLAKMLWEDESAQGATEYILLLMIVVAIVFLFRDNIRGIVDEKIGQLREGMTGITTSF